MNKLFDLTKKESERQKSSLNLIASENYPSPKVLSLLGSVWNDKYAEGYAGKRYYAGNILADELEQFVQTKALEAFAAKSEYGVNVQVLSGSPANMMVYLTVLQPGDTVLSLDLASGGHLSHLHSTSSLLKFYKHASYRLKIDEESYEIDLDDYKSKISKLKPRLVIIGFSAFPKKYDFAELCEIAHAQGSLVLADIAHIAGLVATAQHPSPFADGGKGADFVTTTTHKTLRGPRSALLFGKNEYMEAINKTVFPGTSGGPHLNQIAAVGQALLEVTGEDVYPDNTPFSDYIKQVLENMRALEAGVKHGGIEPITDTQNHLSLLKLKDGMDSLEAQNKLESVGIICNRNSIPNDPGTAWRPSGIRLGSAALTSRGLTTAQASELGGIIAGVINSRISDKAARAYTDNLASNLDWWY